MRESNTLTCKTVEEGLAFVEQKLKELKLQKQIYNQELLVSEEILTKIMEVEKPESIQIKLSKNFGEYSFRFSFNSNTLPELINEDDESDIGGRIIRHYAERIRTRYRKGVATVTVLVKQSYSRYAKLSFLSFLLALLCSYLLERFASEEVFTFVQTQLVWTVEEFFTRAICLIATPVTFFCIAVNVANYSNLADRYPDVKKLVGRYMLTSVIAIAIGYLSYRLVLPMFQGITLSEFRMTNTISLKPSMIWKAIVSMVPENILDPFITSETLPLFLLAAILGTAIGSIDRQSGSMLESVDLVKNLFCKMLAIVFHFSPLAIFVCFMDLIMYYGFKILLYQVYAIAVVFLCCALIMCGYICLLWINGIHSFKVFKTMAKTFWNIFVLGSSIDAIPDTIRDCELRLKLPRKPLEIAIPLGAAIDMDGNCGAMLLITLILSKCSGIELSVLELLLLGVIILTISYGAPNQPGSITVGAMIVLPYVGLSTSLMATILVLEIATSHIIAMSNGMGDIVCTLIVAEREKRAVQKRREANKVTDNISEK